MLKLQEVTIMKSLGKLILATGCCLAMAAGTAFAQAKPVGTNDPGIQMRMEDQEQRIDQGVQSGALTPKEAGRLEAEQTQIQQTEQRMKSDGRLSDKERQRLDNMQDSAGQHIYREMHDPQTANVGSGAAGNVNAPRVQQRMQNQEQRIDQGVKSGRLTPREAGKLEAEQTKIRQTKERMESDGRLTGKERQRLENMQDHADQNIYRQKHDSQKANTK